jgi:hypothetical protein
MAIDTGGLGARQVEFVDMTEEWSAFVAERCRQYEAAQERHVRVQGKALYGNMLQFYQAMDALFSGGNLGGVRVTARKEAPSQEN